MGETIKNTKIKTTSNCNMNDCDYLNDILISFKHLVSSYAIALNEASNKTIYNLFYELFESTSKLQAELFEKAFQNGWYQLETADETKIEKTFQKYNKLFNELSCVE